MLVCVMFVKNLVEFGHSRSARQKRQNLALWVRLLFTHCLNRFSLFCHELLECPHNENLHAPSELEHIGCQKKVFFWIFTEGRFPHLNCIHLSIRLCSLSQDRFKWTRIHGETRGDTTKKHTHARTHTPEPCKVQMVKEQLLLLPVEWR